MDSPQKRASNAKKASMLWHNYAQMILILQCLRETALGRKENCYKMTNKVTEEKFQFYQYIHVKRYCPNFCEGGHAILYVNESDATDFSYDNDNWEVACLQTYLQNLF